MNRHLFGFSLLLLCGTSVLAEEVVLKDGTKIVGKMTAINGDKLELETSYGKIQVNRSDIVSITFPENSHGGAPVATPEKTQPLPAIDESLKGTQYVNKTGNFSLTLPANWKINPELRLSPDVVAALNSDDNLRYLIVVTEAYSASEESYRGLVEIQAKKNLQNYEKVSDQQVTIDGKSILLLSYKGISPQAENLPIQFLVAIIPTAQGYLRITTWCVEPLFKETQGTFESIIRSYRSPATAGKK